MKQRAGPSFVKVHNLEENSHLERREAVLVEIVPMDDTSIGVESLVDVPGGEVGGGTDRDNAQRRGRPVKGLTHINSFSAATAADTL
jgi:hypothetical protein